MPLIPKSLVACAGFLAAAAAGLPAARADASQDNSTTKIYSGAYADLNINDPIPNTDNLILASSSALASITLTQGSIHAGTISALNDGLSSGNKTTAGNNLWLLDLPVTFTITFKAPVNIAAISSVAGWMNHNDASQVFKISYQVSGSDAFKPLDNPNAVKDGLNAGEFGINLPGAGGTPSTGDYDGDYSTDVFVTNSDSSNSHLLTGVTALRITYMHDGSSSDGGTVLHELAVFGTQ